MGKENNVCVVADVTVVLFLLEEKVAQKQSFQVHVMEEDMFICRYILKTQ